MYSTIAEMTNQSSAPKLFTTQVRMTRRTERMTKASTVMVTTVAAKLVPLAVVAMADCGWVRAVGVGSRMDFGEARGD